MNRAITPALSRRIESAEGFPYPLSAYDAEHGANAKDPDELHWPELRQAMDQEIIQDPEDDSDTDEATSPTHHKISGLPDHGLKV